MACSVDQVEASAVESSEYADVGIAVDLEETGKDAKPKDGKALEDQQVDFYPQESNWELKDIFRPWVLGLCLLYILMKEASWAAGQLGSFETSLILRSILIVPLFSHMTWLFVQVHGDCSSPLYSAAGGPLFGMFLFAEGMLLRDVKGAYVFVVALFVFIICCLPGKRGMGRRKLALVMLLGMFAFQATASYGLRFIILAQSKISIPVLSGLVYPTAAALYKGLALPLVFACMWPTSKPHSCAPRCLATVVCTVRYTAEAWFYSGLLMTVARYRGSSFGPIVAALPSIFTKLSLKICGRFGVFDSVIKAFVGGNTSIAANPDLIFRCAVTDTPFALYILMVCVLHAVVGACLPETQRGGAQALLWPETWIVLLATFFLCSIVELILGCGHAYLRGETQLSSPFKMHGLLSKPGMHRPLIARNLDKPCEGRQIYADPNTELQQLKAVYFFVAQPVDDSFVYMAVCISMACFALTLGHLDAIL